MPPREKRDRRGEGAGDGGETRGGKEARKMRENREGARKNGTETGRGKTPSPPLRRLPGAALIRRPFNRERARTETCPHGPGIRKKSGT